MKHKLLTLSLLLCALIVGSGTSWGQTFKRISSVSDLADGDEIIFVNQAETYACGTTQNTNNRTPVEISTTNHTYTKASNDNVQVFVVKINNSGQYGFHTGSGYIYSASNSKNNLKTNTTAVTTAPSGNVAWTISISNNVCSVNNTTNKYNSDSSKPYYLAFNGTSYFSQYYTGQSKPYIYKKTYSVTYNHGGGTGTMTDNNSPYFANSKVTLLENTFTAPANKTFNGWAVTDASSNVVSVTNNQFTMPASNVTVTAQWADAGGGKETSNLTITNQSTDLSFDLYNNTTPQVINYTTSSAGEISIEPATPTSYFSYVHDTANKTITVTPIAVTPSPQTVTISQDADDDYNAGSVSFTVSITDSTPYTVTYSDGGSVTEASAGSGVTLATRSNIGSYTFAGWSTVNISSETTTEPTIISTNATYYPTANITLYPVYTKTVGGAATPTRFSVGNTGNYAIVSAQQNGKYYALPTNPTVNNGKVTAQEITVSETDGVKYVTTANASGFTWTIATGTYGYTLSDGTHYIYHSNGGSSGTNLTYGDDTNKTWAFTADGDYITMAGMSNSTTNNRGLLFSGTTIGGYSLGNAGTNGYYKVMILPISAGSTTYYWSSPVAAAVETPSIVVAENPFLFSTTATITCATDGATIKYSFDGENWSDYSAALTITETKTIYAKAIKDNDESSVAQVTATKNLATPTVTVSGDLTLDLDGETNVTAGTLTAAVTYNQVAVANATVTWSSSDTDIATINESTGAVTIKTTGKVTFTATYAGNSDYAEATGTKTVTVVDSNAPGTTQQNPYTVAQALANTPSSGTSANVYIRGIVSSFYNTDIVSDGNNYRYYISDDGTTTNQLLVYKGKKNSSDNFSSADDLEVGDVVIIYGGLTTYQNAPEIASGNYIVSRTTKAESDLTKTSDITLDYKNNATDADLTEYFTTSSNGAITYTIADETVIERADELISALKVGTTTVTVSQAATQIYKAGEIVIYITVQDTREAATTIPAINISTLKVGDSGTLSVTSPVKADDGVTFSYASSDNDVLLIVDDEYEAIAIGTATVSVTATPSNANLYKPVVANFEVIVETDVKTDTEITLDKESGSTIYGTAKSVDYLITDGYNGTMSYTIDKAAIADVEIGATAITFTPKAVGTAVITFGAPETATFNAAEDVQYTLTVTAPDGGTEAALGPEVLFNETFDECDGSGGRDGTYTGNVGTSATTDKLDETWTSIGSNGASQCIKLGTGSASGAVTTSDISLTGNGTLTFSAAGWGDTKTNTITVTATGANISGETEVTLEASTWNDYTVNITEATGAVAITFTMKRGFLDDVKVTTEGVEITATLNASGYATYCSEYPLDFTSTKGYTAWDLKAIDGNNTMTFERISGKIKGGQGILLKGTANETINLTSANSTDVLEGTKFVGIMVPTYVTKGSYYGLSGDKFKKAANNGVVPAGKAIIYHELINEELQNNEPITVSKFVFVDETTGITTIEEVNREVVEGIFDLQGRRLAQPQKGINIINGKKVVIK